VWECVADDGDRITTHLCSSSSATCMQSNLTQQQASSNGSGGSRTILTLCAMHDVGAWRDRCLAGGEGGHVLTSACRCLQRASDCAQFSVLHDT